MPTKVAILGGGMGALSAAWDLVSHGGYDVTVYQQGWRLGGKGASGRNPDRFQSIEEHGLHILMGFYDHAFAVLKSCYDADPPWPHGRLLPWGSGKERTFTPRDHAAFAQQWKGAWDVFEVPFPPRPGRPWDHPRLPDFLDLLGRGLDVLGEIFSSLRTLPHLPGLGLLKIPVQVLPPVLNEFFIDSIQRAVRTFLAAVWAVVQHHVDDPVVRWPWMGLWLVGANVVGLLDLLEAWDGDGSLAPDFGRIDDEDYRDWLVRQLLTVGCNDPLLTTHSPFVDGLYDLAFSNGTTLAAGITLQVVIRLGLDYRGHVAYSMNAGMGDVVFAPMYLALKAKNVKFRFFHRVRAVRAAGGLVTEIDVEEQIALAGSSYDPLVPAPVPPTYPCWPSRPDPTQLDAAYSQPGAPPYDFEVDPSPSPYRVAVHTLAKAKGDFDVVVLAVPVGAQAAICADLGAQSPAFARSYTNLRTVATQAIQVWLGQTSTSLACPAANGFVISYSRPFNSYADMTHVLAAEAWDHGVTPVHHLAYFCDDFEPQTANPLQEVTAHATSFVAGGLTALWPGFATSSVVAHYCRSNHDPSGRYVLSERGATEHRLASDASGFTNLALAGDWVRTDINAGCLEAATMGGRAAARAIIAGTVHGGEGTGIMASYVERDGDWMMRPPGKLQNVSMWVMVFKAGATELGALCQKYVSGPSSGRVTATPLFPLHPFVLLVCAAIERGESDDPDDKHRGWMSERDVGFFVPVTMTAKGAAPRIVNLIPYLWVDSWVGMIMGREIYGFPKLLGTIEWAGDADPLLPIAPPMHFSVRSRVLPHSSPDGKVIDGPVIDVRSMSLTAGVPIPGMVDEIAAIFYPIVMQALGAPNQSFGSLTRIPQLFLKQFRDAALPSTACAQQLVAVDAQIDDFKGGAVLLNDFALKLPSWQHLDIAGTLGLGAGPIYRPVAAMSAKIDFTIPAGQIVWP
jgi:uncharacterized protein with NAD-binding domain and iron-sulfur cluster